MPTQRGDEIGAATPRPGTANSQFHASGPGIHIETVDSELTQFFHGNITINFNDYRALADGVRGRASTKSSQLIHVLADQLRDSDGNTATFAPTVDPIVPGPPERMPYTDKAVLAWYHAQLDERERYLVQAAAILHGAPVYVVYGAAEALSSIPGEQRAERLEQPIGENSHDLDRLFLRAVVKDGTRRLYWQDADTYGSSAFGFRLLRLLASGIEGTGGMPSAGLLRHIEAWAARDMEGELCWRALRALGAIWWLLDQTRLKEVAQRWAGSQRLQERQRVAWLVLGAYENERSTRTSSKGQYAYTLRLLRDLSDTAWSEPGNAYAVARAYALLGRRWSKIALDGLDYLLGVNVSAAASAGQGVAEHITLPATQAYLRLANYGTVRFILRGLAATAEALASQPRRDVVVPGGARVSDQRQGALATIYFLFFLLTASSIAGADPARHASGVAHATLGAKVTIPDRGGRDTLLAAVVAEREVALHTALRTLFAGAFASGRASLAGDVLQQWANELGVESTPAAHTVAYTDFLYRLGCELKRRDSDEDLHGFDAASTAFQNQLRRWPPWTSAGGFAQRVLHELGYGHV